MKEQNQIDEPKIPFDGGMVFNLKAGRTVRLEALHISGTYAGVLEGDPRYIHEFLLSDVPREVEHRMPPGKPLIVLPSELPLPSWKLMAHLESTKGARTDDPDMYSFLYVCWFQKKLAGSLSGMLRKVLRSIDWETQAENYDATNI